MKIWKVHCGQCGKYYEEIDYDKPLPCCPNYWHKIYIQLRP